MHHGTIEFDGLLQSNDSGHVAFVGSLLQLLHSGIEVGDIGVVMLAMVQRHDLRTNHGLKGTIVVGEVRELEGRSGHFAACGKTNEMSQKDITWKEKVKGWYTRAHLQR